MKWENKQAFCILNSIIKILQKRMLVSKQIGIYWELLNLKWYFQVPKKFQPPLQYLELWRTVPGTGEFDWVSPRSMSNSPHYLRSLFRTSRSRGHLKVGDHALHCFQLLFWNNKYCVELKIFPHYYNHTKELFQNFQWHTA